MNCNKTATRLKLLREEKDLSHKKLADILVEKYHLSFSKQSMINYEKHTFARGISVEKLLCFADFYNVTTDYLLGISDCRNISADEVIAKTGLTEKSIQRLTECAQSKQSNDPFLYGLNYLIENDASESQNEKKTLRLLINYLSSGSERNTKVVVDENGVRLKKYKKPTDFLPPSKIYFDEFDAEQIISSLYLNDLNECIKKEKISYKNSEAYADFLKTVTDYKQLEMQRFMDRYKPRILSPKED